MRGELLPGVADGDFEKLVSCAPAIDVRQVERVILAATHDALHVVAVAGLGDSVTATRQAAKAMSAGNVWLAMFERRERERPGDRQHSTVPVRSTKAR